MWVHSRIALLICFSWHSSLQQQMHIRPHAKATCVTLTSIPLWSLWNVGFYCCLFVSMFDIISITSREGMDKQMLCSGSLHSLSFVCPALTSKGSKRCLYCMSHKHWSNKRHPFTSSRGHIKWWTCIPCCKLCTGRIGVYRLRSDTSTFPCGQLRPSCSCHRSKPCTLEEISSNGLFIMQVGNGCQGEWRYHFWWAKTMRLQHYYGKGASTKTLILRILHWGIHWKSWRYYNDTWMYFGRFESKNLK
jgi:hypothetical protein